MLTSAMTAGGVRAFPSGYLAPTRQSYLSDHARGAGSRELTMYSHPSPVRGLKEKK
jgi:hypothetical protein